MIRERSSSVVAFLTSETGDNLHVIFKKPEQVAIAAFLGVDVMMEEVDEVQAGSEARDRRPRFKCQGNSSLCPSPRRIPRAQRASCFWRGSHALHKHLPS
jgi:hypothetical protein